MLIQYSIRTVKSTAIIRSSCMHMSTTRKEIEKNIFRSQTMQRFLKIRGLTSQIATPSLTATDDQRVLTTPSSRWHHFQLLFFPFLPFVSVETKRASVELCEAQISLCPYLRLKIEFLVGWPYFIFCIAFNFLQKQQQQQQRNPPFLSCFKSYNIFLKNIISLGDNSWVSYENLVHVWGRRLRKMSSGHRNISCAMTTRTGGRKVGGEKTFGGKHNLARRGRGGDESRKYISSHSHVWEVSEMVSKVRQNSVLTNGSCKSFNVT